MPLDHLSGTTNYSFHHYPHPAAVLEEMRRVLKPGGHLVFSDPWFPGVLRHLANFVVRLSKLGDVRMYSFKEWRTLLTTADMQIARLDHGATTCFVVARKAE